MSLAPDQDSDTLEDVLPVEDRVGAVGACVSVPVPEVVLGAGVEVVVGVGFGVTLPSLEIAG